MPGRHTNPSPLIFGFVFALVFGAGAGAFAQQPAPEVTSRDAPATFQTKVNLVLVPVVVRDRKGNAVGTLKKEDFLLLDKGKPQVISKFSVEKNTPGAVQSGLP